jgi:pSer/pThr/pTyr-binding forkhead associated (FHA) protein
VPSPDPSSYQPGQPLVVRMATGNLAGRVIPLRVPLRMGRETDNDLVLLDPKVSRHHARLEPREGSWVVVDLNSRNGTRLNGLRIVRAGLVAGDFVYVGDTVLSIEAADGQSR